MATKIGLTPKKVEIKKSEVKVEKEIKVEKTEK
jgi:hypothetical protein